MIENQNRNITKIVFVLDFVSFLQRKSRENFNKQQFKRHDDEIYRRCDDHNDRFFVRKKQSQIVYFTRKNSRLI